MDILAAVWLYMLDKWVAVMVNPWWVNTLWLVYLVVFIVGFRIRFADGTLRRYALNYGERIILLATPPTPPPESDKTNTSTREQQLERLDRSLTPDHDAEWYYFVFDSPRKIALVIVLQTLVWPVEAVVRPLYHLTKWAIGLHVLDTLRAVITLKE